MSKAYKQAGVNIEAGYDAVERMKSHVKRTERTGVMGALGGFGGMFDLSELNYHQPVLVSGTDGVGTKIKLAFSMNKHDTIGIDAVAMCVNDIVAQGADPLYFLDYLAVGKADPEKIEAIVKGVADGCEQAGCALIGGETAEMPGIYDADEYDLAGFSVGASEKADLITGADLANGDVLIGLPSSGIHSNGFSLVRKVLLDDHQLDLAKVYEPFQLPLGEILLTPTRIYAKQITALKQVVKMKSIAHITGGGFYENIPRMLTNGLGATVNVSLIETPAIFDFIHEHGQLTDEDMYQVFNMGIGMVIAVSPQEAELAVKTLEELGEAAVLIGEVNQSGELSLIKGEE
ncbi:phosphoribosylformylglycinamidine cyclo-ligase [Halalkalibacillus halophilus]|uniref:phosphoribosylformylglycinamidine cyclo-ligase n=1 Tax=Halalkalibacillus halophilus TaxID=392827 RepID=UPI00040CC666|nr:phosphoribosylformylglycinamidine cyclo-ligase [Halalkalibacillus halophilus]